MSYKFCRVCLGSAIITAIGLNGNIYFIFFITQINKVYRYIIFLYTVSLPSYIVRKKRRNLFEIDLLFNDSIASLILEY